jgi:hypothetical protein
MKLILLLLFAVVSAYSQSLSFGVKAGVPVTDAYADLQTPNGTASHFADHYTVGPTIELHLPFQLSIEADALYRHSGFGINGGTGGTASSSVNEWQIPLLAKVEIIPLGPIRPFVDGGLAYRHLSVNTSGTGLTVQNPNNSGFVLGGGVTLKLLRLRLAPELRFTHWGQVAFSNLAVSSSQNQADFLVGFTF